MKCSFSKLTLATLMLSLAQASTAQDLFDRSSYEAIGSELVSQLNSCATLPDQFSQNTYNCIVKTNSNILSETSKTIVKNKSYYAQYESGNSAIFNADQAIKKLNSDCLSTFPKPLQAHFKNQIAYCQAQVNLNRYFFFNDIYFD